MRSIVFAHPFIYSIAVRFLYFDGLKILKDIIGKQKAVFEPACGFGRMKKYIHGCCTYSGIDLNERFIHFGQKRHRDIRLGNILDKVHYQDCDVIVLSDILHHLTIPDIRELLSIAVQFAREKIVIIEPEFVTLGAGRNLFCRFVARLMAIMDFDGFNRIKKWMSHNEYESLFISLKNDHQNIENLTIRRFRKHFFVELQVKSNGNRLNDEYHYGQ